MNVNWFTVIAQVINFLILVWLLKRFLYKPILNAIDEREKKITAELKDADDKKAAAIKEQDDFNKRNAEFDQQKKLLMDKAIADTNAQRDKLFQDAKDEANTLRSNLEKSIKESQQNDELANADKTQKRVFSITKKLLKEMASSSLEDQSVNTFIRRLSSLSDGEKKRFMDAFKSNTNLPAGRQVPILVRSAFGLSANQQAAINDSVNNLLSAKSQLQFTTSPELINGIELTTNGYKLAWSFSEYLNALQNNLAEIKKSKPKDEAEKKAEAAKIPEPKMNGIPVNN
jgi:F-type H+-transporting ATPase subunit b